MIHNNGKNKIGEMKRQLTYKERNGVRRKCG